MEPLDNPVWHALTGPHARFAQGTGLALRYDPEVSVFSAMPNAPGPDAWHALRTLLGASNAGVIVQRDLELPGAFEVVLRLGGHQMVATETIGDTDDQFVPLTSADVDDALALVARTKPGPFTRRTIELGTYLGLRDDDGALIAMAGERMHLPGYTEISAVCTDEHIRKRGLATRLIRAIAAGIEARAETPILHVATENNTAIRVYEALGFETRVTFDFVIVRPHG
jgi:ribosomal protein S18 acetylase RimI-like enzyme